MFKVGQTVHFVKGYDTVYSMTIIPGNRIDTRMGTVGIDYVNNNEKNMYRNFVDAAVASYKTW